MKFITEQDLRSRYRAEPFTSYTPEPGTRLTPGARQFLTDRYQYADAGVHAFFHHVLDLAVVKN